tara:strand:+ start:2851 stop:3060 length:210 start_codon:yes stop_codon:yes gene_type:complete
MQDQENGEPVNDDICVGSIYPPREASEQASMTDRMLLESIDRSLKELVSINRNQSVVMERNSRLKRAMI